MFRIGEFSKMSKVAIKTLRYYDEVDLLKPEHIDPETNYRLYSTEQLIKIHTIQSYRQIGLSLNEIRLLFLGKDESEVLESRKHELLAEQQRLQEQLTRINFLRSDQIDEQYMNYRAVVKETPGGIIYAKKMRVHDYTDYFEAIPPLGVQLKELNPGIECSKPEYSFIVYLDGEYKEQDRYVEFCECVDRFGIAPEGMEFRELAPVTVVSVMHRGSYADLGLAYAYAACWIEKNGYIIAGNPRENFIDSIWNKENEADWLTEVQIPIAK